MQSWFSNCYAHKVGSKIAAICTLLKRWFIINVPLAPHYKLQILKKLQLYHIQHESLIPRKNTNTNEKELSSAVPRV